MPFLVNVEVTARGHQQAQAAGRLEDADREPVPTGSREIFVLAEEEWVESPAYRRDELRRGHRIAGPAVVDQLDSTVIILPGFVGDAPARAIVLTREADAA